MTFCISLTWQEYAFKDISCVSTPTCFSIILQPIATAYGTIDFCFGLSWVDIPTGTSSYLSIMFLILCKFECSIGVGYSPTQCISEKSLFSFLNKLYTLSKVSNSIPAVDIIILRLILLASRRSGQSSLEQLAIFTMSMSSSGNHANDSLSNGVAIVNSPFDFAWLASILKSSIDNRVLLNLLTYFLKSLCMKVSSCLNWNFIAAVILLSLTSFAKSLMILQPCSTLPWWLFAISNTNSIYCLL